MQYVSNQRNRVWRNPKPGRTEKNNRSYYFEWPPLDPNRGAPYSSTQLSYRVIGAESGAILSEGLAGLAREAEVEYSLWRHWLRKLDALSGDRDHLPLQFFVHNAG